MTDNPTVPQGEHTFADFYNTLSLDPETKDAQPQPEPDRRVAITTYNVLDPFLSRHTVPRSMPTKYEEKFDFKDMEAAYREFHKNTKGKADKYFKREVLWDTNIESQDVLNEISQYTGNEHIKVVGDNKFIFDGEGIDPNNPNVSREHGNIYTYISNSDKNVVETIKRNDNIKWSTRGDSVLRHILSMKSDIFLLQEYGQSHNLCFTTSVSLLEKTETTSVAVDEETETTLANALFNHGYSYIFYIHPAFGVDAVQSGKNVEGVAIFYKAEKWTTAYGHSGLIVDCKQQVIVEKGDKTQIEGRAPFRCIDLDVPVMFTDIDRKGNIKPDTMTDMVNRKVAGIIHLTSVRHPDMSLVVANAHFVTDTRDLTGKYKAREYALLKLHIRDFVSILQSSPRIIMGGDFNTKYAPPATNKVTMDRAIINDEHPRWGVVLSDNIALRNAFSEIKPAPDATTRISPQDPKIIDYIFYDTRLQYINGNINTNIEEYLIAPSDHYPVTVHLNY